MALIPHYISNDKCAKYWTSSGDIIYNLYEEIHIRNIASTS